MNKGKPEYDLSDSDSESEFDKSEQGKSKKKYSVIPQAVREKFIQRVLSKEVTIKEAAKEFGLKFSTSKAILQTYKKEGRIGKKKNRERKTKVVNAVFLVNINPSNPQTSTVVPVISINEIKGSKDNSQIQANKNKLVQQTLLANPEYKFDSEKQVQIPAETNKSTQQFIKDLGNDFLKDYIDKNIEPQLQAKSHQGSSAANQSRSILPKQQDSSEMISRPNKGKQGDTSNPNIPKLSNTGDSIVNEANMNILNNPTQYQPQFMHGYPIPQVTYNYLTSFNQTTNLGHNQSQQAGGSEQQQQGGYPGNVQIPPIFAGRYGMMDSNQLQSQLSEGMGLIGQRSEDNGINSKRTFEALSRGISFGEYKDQINDSSVKRFRSGEDALWELDYDKSKKDLEDFIFKTHTALKNKEYIEKQASFDFSKYKDQFE